MSDPRTILLLLVAIGAGASLVHGATNRPRNAGRLTLAGLSLLAGISVAGWGGGMTTGAGLVAATCSLFLLIHVLIAAPLARGQVDRGPLLPAVFTAVIGGASLYAANQTGIRDEDRPTPLVIMDQQATHAELTAIVRATLIDVELALGRDVGPLEVKARADEDFERLETLQRIRRHLERERTGLRALSDELMTSAPIPERTSIERRLGGIARLLDVLRPGD